MRSEQYQPRICLVSSVPSTLWVFYRDLVSALQGRCAVELTASNEAELHYFEQRLSCRVFPCDIARRISPARDVRALWRLMRLFGQRRYDLVHAHTPKGGLLGMAAAYLSGVRRRVYTVHGLPLETAKGWKRRLLWLAERASCSLASVVLVVSPSLKRRLIEERLCPPGKMRVLGNGTACGVDVQCFRADDAFRAQRTAMREQLGIEADAVVVGYAGRITPDKGVDTLVNAFLRLAHYVPQARLLVVGPLDEARQQVSDHFLQQLQTDKRICFVDVFVEDLRPYYAAMDMVVLPSHREGFGMTLLEAAALELPTVATRVTGCVDAVVDGVTGLLVERDNPAALGEALAALAVDPQRRRQLGQAGRQRVVDLFDSRMITQAHLDLYAALLRRDQTCSREQRSCAAGP